MQGMSGSPNRCQDGKLAEQRHMRLCRMQSRGYGILIENMFRALRNGIDGKENKWGAFQITVSTFSEKVMPPSDGVVGRE